MVGLKSGDCLGVSHFFAVQFILQRLAESERGALCTVHPATFISGHIINKQPDVISIASAIWQVIGYASDHKSNVAFVLLSGAGDGNPHVSIHERVSWL